MNTKEAFKKDVYDSNANRVGRVTDIVFDLPTGTISHVVVRTGLMKKQDVAVGLIAKSGDTIVLTVPKEKLNGEAS